VTWLLNCDIPVLDKYKETEKAENPVTAETVGIKAEQSPLTTPMKIQFPAPISL